MTESENRPAEENASEAEVDNSDALSHPSLAGARKITNAMRDEAGQLLKPVKFMNQIASDLAQPLSRTQNALQRAAMSHHNDGELHIKATDLYSEFHKTGQTVTTGIRDSIQRHKQRTPQDRKALANRFAPDKTTGAKAKDGERDPNAKDANENEASSAPLSGVAGQIFAGNPLAGAFNSQKPSNKPGLGAVASEAAHVATSNAAKTATKSGVSAAISWWGPKIASRAIPGAGWALLGYDAISTSYEFATGKNWSDTKVGGAIESAASTVGHGAFNSVGTMLKYTGFPKAAAFVSNDAQNFFMGADGKEKDPTVIAQTEGSTTARFQSTPWKEVSEADLPKSNYGAVSIEAKRNYAAAEYGSNATMTFNEAMDKSPASLGEIDSARVASARLNLKSEFTRPNEQNEIIAAAIGALPPGQPPTSAAMRRNNDGIGF